MNKKAKSFWMYTIILFTVALVLILFSLVLSDNRGNYESKIQTLQNENLTLKNEKKALEDKNASLNVSIAGLEEQNRQLATKSSENELAAETYANAVEAIYIADGLCDEERYTEAKEKLDSIDATILKEKIRTRYDKVKAEIDANVEGE